MFTLIENLGNTNLRQALVYYNQILELDPNNALAWLGKGTTIPDFYDLNFDMISEVINSFQNVAKNSIESDNHKYDEEIALAFVKLAVNFYKQSADSFIESYNTLYKDEPAFMDRLLVSFNLFDIVLTKYPQYSMIKRSAKFAVDISKDMMESSHLSKQNRNGVLKEKYNHFLEIYNKI